MSLTVIQPNSLCLAGNPIVVKATTNKSLSSNEAFLRIVLEASFTAAEHTYLQTHKVEMSCPVEDGGTASFNLSDSVQTHVQRIHSEIDMNDSSTQHVWYQPVSVRCHYTCKEVWLRDNEEQVVEHGTTYSFYAVPGALTDYEMLTMTSIDLTSLITGKPMSRKPDLGIVYNGETVILPVISSYSNTPTLSIAVDGVTVASGGGYLSSNALDYQYLTVTHASDGELTMTSSYVGSFSGHYRTNTNGVHFLRFINGFGAVENIAVRSKDKLSYAVEGEVHSLVQEASVRPTDRRYAVKSQPVGVYELSSGYVPQRWAEWYVQELLTSPRVWIQLGGKWVPALIEAEDDCVIYDRTKPEMPHVDFTLRLAIDGVTGCTW